MCSTLPSAIVCAYADDGEGSTNLIRCGDATRLALLAPSNICGEDTTLLLTTVLSH
jgi:hypothetical protein